MKQKIAFSIVIVFCLVAVLPVFSQKIKTGGIKNIPAPKETPQSNVKLSSAEAFSDGNGVYLRWQAESETRNLGFYIYRVSAKGTELVSPGIVGGASLTSSDPIIYGRKYSFFDPSGNLTVSYYIESIGSNGQRQTFEQLFPKYLDDLTKVAGFSSQELIDQEATVNNQPESNVLNLSKEMRSDIEANTLGPNIINQRWVASQPGVKISIKQDGLYRVSRTELQNAGFNVSAPGSLWQLFLDGNEQSIVVGDNDSYIEFYGKGIDTLESGTRIYYLIAGAQNGLRMGTAVVRPLSGVVANNYSQSFVQKYRQVYVSNNILNGVLENFFSNQVILGSSSPTPATTTLTFNLTGVDFSSPNSTFDLSIQGLTIAPHNVVAKLNGTQMDPIIGTACTLMSGSYQIPTSVLREGANTLQLQSFGGSGDITLPESIKIKYLRKYQAIQNQLSFYSSNYRTATVSGFTSPNIRVFDLTYPDNPTLLTGLNINNNAGNFSVTLPANRGRVAYAAEDSALLTASSIVANNPSTLSTTGHNGELIIVTYKDWATQANDWANYRRGQGMTVEVVDIEDIFDEFSYGTVSTAGMNQFFQYAKTNWQTPPNYILLLGDMSYDFRNYENRPFQNFIPTKLFDTLYEETGSDDALSDLNNDNLADIAIGRIPVRNGATVTQLLNKTMVFESTVATGFNRGAVFPSDIGFEEENQVISQELPASMPKTFISRGDTDSHTTLINALNAGPYIVNYTGHGSTGIWNGNFLTISDSLALTNAPNYTFYTMLSCLNGYFIQTQFDSLGEALLKSQNGGAVAVWASTGQTVPIFHRILAARFYHQMALGNMTRLGDLVKDAKQILIGGDQDVLLSWVLLGDPTLKVR